MLRVVKAADRCRELLDDAAYAIAPVRAGHDDEKVITADVADEVEACRQGAFQQAREMQDDLIALCITVNIVVRLERIEIEVAHDEAPVVFDQPVDAAAHGAIA